MTRIARLPSAFLLAVFSTSVLAHPQHGESAGFAAGIIHPMLGLDHLLAMAAAGIWAVQLGGRALWTVPLSFVMAIAAGGVFALLGYSLPQLEPMIAVSVLGLGLLVSASVKTGAPASFLLISLFAFWHGVAHGIETPGQAVTVLFALGLISASALFLTLGMAAAVLLRSGTRLAGIPITLAGGWLLVAAFS
jgi:urease accessory protein